MFKNEEYSSFLNIVICLVLKPDKFTIFLSQFRPLGYYKATTKKFCYAGKIKQSRIFDIIPKLP